MRTGDTGLTEGGGVVWKGLKLEILASWDNVVIISDKTQWCLVKKMWIKEKSHIYICLNFEQTFGLFWDVKPYGRIHKESMLGILLYVIFDML